MANIKELSDKGPDGTRLGQSSTDLVGFWGATPAAQPSGSSQAKVTATATTAMSTTLTISAANTSKVFGFSSSTVAKEIVKSVKEQQVDLAAAIVLVNKLRADLVTLGLIAGA